MEDSLYQRLPGQRYLPTELTQGPWSAGSQHGGPVAALLAHVLESSAPPGWLTAQFTVDFLVMVPLSELTARTEVVKEGRRARCVAAILSGDDRVYARARAWQVAPGRFAPAPVPAGTGGTAPDSTAYGRGEPGAAPLPVPAASSYARASFRFGYQRAVEMRFVRGSFRAQGPAVAWARLLVPLLPDTPACTVARVMAVADFGSGISAAVDRSAWTYHNLDLSVHLHRYPAGEWVCLDSASVVGPEGTGLCRTTLHDENGPVGAAAQSLFVAAVRGHGDAPVSRS